MSAPITPINPGVIHSVEPAGVSSATPGAAPGTFQSMLSDAVGNVEQFRENSDKAIDNFLSGGTQELHQVALAAQQSEMAFEMFVQVRNKVISAYQEIMRMQL